MKTDQDLPTVIVLGASFPGLGVIQSLGMRGVKIWACAPRRSIGTRSRYVRYWWVPDPIVDEAAMMARVTTLAASIPGTPVLISTDDQYAQVIARNRKVFDGFSVSTVPDREIIDLLVDKQLFSDWAQTVGIRHPRSVPADSFCTEGDIEFPVTIKPRLPFYITTAVVPRDLRCVPLENADAWERFRREHEDLLRYLIVQEFIPGMSEAMYSIGLYADRQSKIKGLFVGRKLRGFPPLFGDTRAGQNDVVPDAVLSEVESIVQKLRYSGIAEFEYKRHPTTGEFHLIEVNPRTWSWIGVTTASSADIPWIAYQDLAGTTPAVAWHNQEPGKIKYVRAMWDFFDVVVRNRWVYPPWATSPRGWWRSLKAERLVIAEFGRGDWPVAYWSVLHLIKALLYLTAIRLKQRAGPVRSPRRADPCENELGSF